MIRAAERDVVSFALCVQFLPTAALTGSKMVERLPPGAVIANHTYPSYTGLQCSGVHTLLAKQKNIYYFYYLRQFKKVQSLYLIY